MKPKKDELAVLVELNNQEYASEKEFLEVMFDSVVTLLLERDSWGVGIKFTESGGVTPYGPFYNKAQAAAAGKKYQSVLQNKVFLQQLNAPAKLLNKENDD